MILGSLLLVAIATSLPPFVHSHIGETVVKSILKAAIKVTGVCPPVNNVSDKNVCLLRLSQFTLTGSHNSGSGPDMTLSLFSLPAPSCKLQNQEISITQQLHIGVRAFDFDVAYKQYSSEKKDKGVIVVHCSDTPEICAYSMSLRLALNDIKKFLSSNPHEIVSIRIKDHYVENETERVLLIKGILEIIKGTIGYRMINYYTDPTLGSALLLKRPVFFYIHTDLWEAIKHVRTPLRKYRAVLRPVKALETWYGVENEINLTCDLKEDTLDYFEEDETQEIMLNYPWMRIVSDWYPMNAATLNICLKGGAESCEEYVEDNVNITRYLQQNFNRTINVLMADFVSLKTVETVNTMNKLNIKHFVVDEMGPQRLKISFSRHTTKYPFAKRGKKKKEEDEEEEDDLELIDY